MYREILTKPKVVCKLLFSVCFRRQGIKLRRLMTFAWPCLLPKQCVVRKHYRMIFTNNLMWQWFFSLRDL